MQIAGGFYRQSPFECLKAVAAFSLSPADLEERGVMKILCKLYARFATLASYLQSPFLLGVRLYWGWQLVQSGWGKLHHLQKVTEFFTSLNLPAPAATATLIA